jgi:hypothetical protein
VTDLRRLVRLDLEGLTDQLHEALDAVGARPSEAPTPIRRNHKRTA